MNSPTIDDATLSEWQGILNQLIRQIRNYMEEEGELHGLEGFPGLYDVRRMRPDIKSRFCLYLAELIKVSKETHPPPPAGNSSHLHDWHLFLMISGHLLGHTATLTEKEFIAYVQAYLAVQEACNAQVDLPYTALLDHAEQLIKKQQLTPAIEEALTLLKRPDANLDAFPENRRINDRIDLLLLANHDQLYSMRDAWGKQLFGFVHPLPAGEKAAWNAFLAFSVKQGEKSAPAKEWNKKVRLHIEAVGEGVLARQLVEWLEQVKQMIRDLLGDEDRFTLMTEENHNLLRALIWSAGLVNVPELNNALEDYADWAFKKKRGMGVISARTGTACMHAFSLLPYKEGVSRLSSFRMKIRNNTVIRSIDKMLAAVAQQNS